MCGRNFEYFSEDPYLAGKLAAAYIRGMEQLGVGTSLKHFAVNNQETRRMTMNSQIDDRALREIYLKPFEIAVKEGKPTTVMASYNRVNGEYSCANKFLLTDILRNEWGFEGAVISDWGAAIDVVQCIKAGMDLEMPDSLGIHTKQILDAIKKKTLTMEELDRAVDQVVNLVTTLAPKRKKVTIDYQKQHEIAVNLACESAVLLKNEGVLPLDKQCPVLVIGDLAVNMRFQGGGSSHITTAKTKNTVEALKESGIEVAYVKGYDKEKDETIPELEEEAVRLARAQMPILFFGGLTEQVEGEGYDRKTLQIPECQIHLLNRLYAVNNKIIVVTLGGGPMLMPFLPKVKAVLHMYLGGQGVGEACARLLLGQVNPSGKLAETFPRSLDDVPNKEFYAPDSDDVEYRESIFVGYRYYDTFHVPVLFEFGYGLSYTTFAYSQLEVEQTMYTQGTLKVRCTISNTGDYIGKEIVQVYVVNPKSTYLRAHKELRGFTKVELKPGESKVVEIVLPEDSFCLYDVKQGKYIMPSGKYKICVGASSQDIRLEQEIQVEGVHYDVDQRTECATYFQLEQEKGKTIESNAFQVLYGKPFSQFDAVKKGEYTIYHSLQTLGKHSKVNRLALRLIKALYYRMNKGKPKTDPGVQMIISALCEGPLDCVICASDGMFPLRIGEALVLIANGHCFKAMGRLLRK
ncbi:glycoside hydrolase family 3 C-terminal domain-containing protein [Anaerosporobacter faecicola]|uniref:glycoside hydrolase family 3 C-terminal domain-containing protein n=1 Tax=Anaerosporobacter faecicola TaxID=2718714 RepID=UPI001438B192|nr:glycoside hydrolase family 3 C-terminal domain-containing protein [Anaerosporobacter faecicola]